MLAAPGLRKGGFMKALIHTKRDENCRSYFHVQLALFSLAACFFLALLIVLVVAQSLN
jgi:hypothetical protein